MRGLLSLLRSLRDTLGNLFGLIGQVIELMFCGAALCGKTFQTVRDLFLPLLNCFQVLSNCGIAGLDCV